MIEISENCLLVRAKRSSKESELMIVEPSNLQPLIHKYFNGMSAITCYEKLADLIELRRQGNSHAPGFFWRDANSTMEFEFFRTNMIYKP